MPNRLSLEMIVPPSLKEPEKVTSLSSTRIDISSLEVGNYIIIVNSDSGKQLGKFVKTQ